MTTKTFEVVVGNIGTVYSGPSFAEACAKFTTYKEQSETGYGRAGGESVTIMQDGDLMNSWDYQPVSAEEEE